MPLPLLAGLGSIVGGAIFKFGKEAFKWGVFITFIGVLVTTTIVFWGFFSTIYNKVQGGIDGLGTSYGGLLGCVINSLGIDIFMTSALAIFTTASIFWGTSVAYIVAFKFGKIAYSNLLKIL